MNWGQLSGRLMMNSLEQKIPLIGEFELTPRCNLRCKMCYICKGLKDKGAINKELPAKDWIRLALEAREEGMLFLLLTGGEIFVRKDFAIIYDEISRMGFNVTLYTNGTLITPQIAGWLGNYPPSQVEITLYGASSKTYESLCGDGGGFEKAIRGIRLLKEQGINVQLRTTIVKKNVGDFEALAEIASNYGLPLGIVSYISPRREGDLNSPKEERLPPKELADFEERVSRFYLNKQEKKTSALQAADDYKATEKKDLSHESLSQRHINSIETFPCTSAKNSFWMTWDGRMVPCSMMNKPQAFPLEIGFKNAWQQLKAECNRVPNCKTCGNCSMKDYCNSCPAGLMNETGSFTEISPYLCQLARERKNKENEVILNTDGR